MEYDTFSQLEDIKSLLSAIILLLAANTELTPEQKLQFQTLLAGVNISVRTEDFK